MTSEESDAYSVPAKGKSDGQRHDTGNLYVSALDKVAEFRRLHLQYPLSRLLRNVRLAPRMLGTYIAATCTCKAVAE